MINLSCDEKNLIHKVDNKELDKIAQRYYKILLKNDNYKLVKSKDLDSNTKEYYWEENIGEEILSQYNFLKLILNEDGTIKSISKNNSNIVNENSEDFISKKNAEKIIEEFSIFNNYKYTGNMKKGYLSS